MNKNINNKKNKCDCSIEEDKNNLKELKEIRTATGFSMSKLIDLRKKGYKIVKL